MSTGIAPPELRLKTLIQEISLDKIKPSRANPRRRMDDAALAGPARQFRLNSHTWRRIREFTKLNMVAEKFMGDGLACFFQRRRTRRADL